MIMMNKQYLRIKEGERGGGRRRGQLLLCVGVTVVRLDDTIWGQSLGFSTSLGLRWVVGCGWSSNPRA